jgi:hypothetical protein
MELGGSRRGGAARRPRADPRAAGYICPVVLLRVVPIVGVVAALAGSAVAGSPSPPAGVSPVLASTPFGAVPGRQVTHTVTLSGTGVVAAVRVTFTTTVGLDGVTAAASNGACPVVTALRVVCDFSGVDLSSGTAPTMTISGTVHPGTAPGTLVQNVVTVGSPGGDGDRATDVVSNAYLVAAGNASPPAAPTGGADPSHRTADAYHAQTNPLPTVGAALALVGLAVGGLLLRLRRRRS